MYIVSPHRMIVKEKDARLKQKKAAHIQRAPPCYNLIFIGF